jgi:hypothetical protein
VSRFTLPAIFAGSVREARRFRAIRRTAGNGASFPFPVAMEHAEHLGFIGRRTFRLQDQQSASHLP